MPQIIPKDNLSVVIDILRIKNTLIIGYGTWPFLQNTILLGQLATKRDTQNPRAFLEKHLKYSVCI